MSSEPQVIAQDSGGDVFRSIVVGHIGYVVQVAASLEVGVIQVDRRRDDAFLHDLRTHLHDDQCMYTGMEKKGHMCWVRDIRKMDECMDGAVRTTASMPPAAPKLCPIMDLMDDTLSLYA